MMMISSQNVLMVLPLITLLLLLNGPSPFWCKERNLPPPHHRPPSPSNSPSSTSSPSSYLSSSGWGIFPSHDLSHPLVDSSLSPPPTAGNTRTKRSTNTNNKKKKRGVNPHPHPLPADEDLDIDLHDTLSFEGASELNPPLGRFTKSSLPPSLSTSSSHRARIKRQEGGGEGAGGEGEKTEPEETPPVASLTCDFGAADAVELCTWNNPLDAHPNIRWKIGQGVKSYWLGGPTVDKSADDPAGGYVYFETSYKAVNRVFSSAALESGADVRINVMDDSLPGFNVGSPHNNNNGSNPMMGSPPVPGMVSGITSYSDKKDIYKQGLSVHNIEESMVPVVPSVAHLKSPNISVSGPQGICLTFHYNLDGLSAEKLRILVKDYKSPDSGPTQTLWESTIDTDGKWVRQSISYAFETTHQLMLEGVAKNLEEPERAYRGYVAVDDISFQPMGDGSDTASCYGHCTFEGGMCGWTNQEEGDDFDWIVARGSDNFFTGPARDYYSFSKEYPLGGFIFIDAGFPRRPGDRAMLISPTFEPTGENQAVCFKFATHMYGNGIGTLKVWLRPTEGGDENPPKILWEMTGDAGNNWYMAQLPIASAVSYAIALEGIVGSNYLGNIAIDSISIEQGSCPISPQTASRKSGDCTFEENMCFWTNPVRESNLDDFDWIRQFSYGNFGPKRDHTKKNELGYFMSLNGDHMQPKRGGTFAWLISGEFPTSPLPKCMTFYYFMYQRVIDPGGPSLGGMRVFIRTTDANNNVVLIPVWRLNNHQSMKWRRARVALAMKVTGEGGEAARKGPSNPYQVVIEGIWGDARVGSIALDDMSFVDGDCTTLPTNAVAIEGECSFDRNMCGWMNLTKKATPGGLHLSPKPSSLSPQPRTSVNSGHPLRHPLSTGESVTWRLASPNSRPSNLQDHTFRAPIGYIFFDVFNQNQVQNPVFRSKKYPAKEGEVSQKCLSFWFSPFGRSEVTQLNVYQTVEGATGDADIGEAPPPSSGSAESTGNKVLIWSIQTRKFDTRRPQWYYGQATVNAATPHEIYFEGEAIDGGFAIDDITFYDGLCQTRPKDATVTSKPEES